MESLIAWWRSLSPEPIVVSFGAVNIFWYGLLISLALLVGLWLFYRLSRRMIDFDTAANLVFWLAVGGILGGRLYYVAMMWQFYINDLLEIFKLWHGGLAIQGAIIGGALTLRLFAKRNRLEFFNLAARLVPALALGQAIGRWGNYFNQELFGPPANLPWSIYIKPALRPLEFQNSALFHPAFLYESILNLFLCLILFVAIKRQGLADDPSYNRRVVAAYIGLYGVIRFAVEFFRIDAVPLIWGMRWTQVFSLLMALVGLVMFVWPKRTTHNT